jgi:formate dehydrogenase
MEMMQERIEHSFCRICESLCGLELKINGDEITQIIPDNNHVATRGFACPKGLKQNKLYDSPDRLTHPMKRVGMEWHRQNWEIVMQEIGEKVNSIQARYSKDSVAMYVGTAAGFGVLHPIFAQGFMDAIGSKSMFASATQDCSNKFAVSELMYGFPFTLSFPDILQTNCLIIVGANPVVSKWSFLQVPNPSLHLKEMERRGAKIYVVDPRRTETAKVAGEYVAIRPNTDVFFYLSFLNELEKQNGLDKTLIEKYTQGSTELLSIANNWPAEKTAGLTGIDAQLLKKMVRDYINADGAAMYSSTGVNMGLHGTLAFWIQECINVMSGNLDRKGGSLIGKGIIDFPKFAKKKGILLRKDRSRIGNFRSVNDVYPGGILADEILTPGKKQIRALFVTGGNPLITMANSNRLRKAFENLELLVTLDIYPNETGSIGHYMLPCTSPFQRPDLPFIFPLMLGLQTKPYLQATKAILPPRELQRDEASIYLALCRASKRPIFGSSIAQKFLEFLQWNYSRNNKNKSASLPQEFLLNCLLKLCRQKSFKHLLKHPHGILRKAHQAGTFLSQRVLTEDKKVHLAPKMLMGKAKNLGLYFENEKKSMGQFKLISKRYVTTHNSWTHNLEEFVRGERSTNYLYMNPADMGKLGLQKSEKVDISTKSGTLRVPVKALQDLMPGTVALPHGWGHQASNLKVAGKTKGVNVNILVADGPESIEEISGMVQLTGISVVIKPASGASDFDSWSGLEKDRLDVAKLRN